MGNNRQTKRFCKLWIVNCFSPSFQGLISIKMGIIDSKGMNVSQPIWFSGCPIKGHFRSKIRIANQPIFSYAYIQSYFSLNFFLRLLMSEIQLMTDSKLIQNLFAIYWAQPDLLSNIFPILGRFFVNNVGCQSNHFCKTYNKAKCYEKSQIFNLW